MDAPDDLPTDIDQLTWDERCRLFGEVLDSPEITALIAEIAAGRRTGRLGYGTRAMVGMVLVRTMFDCASWMQASLLAGGYPEIAEALGTPDVPSVWACYRFARRLRDLVPVLERCAARLAEAATEELPGAGDAVSFEAVDLVAFTRGNLGTHHDGPLHLRTSHPDATFGRWSNSWPSSSRPSMYGYKVRAMVCAATGLPLRWWFTAASTEAHQLAAEQRAALPPQAKVVPRQDRTWLELPSAVEAPRAPHMVPFGTRGMPATRVLVEVALLTRLARAVMFARLDPPAPRQSLCASP